MTPQAYNEHCKSTVVVTVPITITCDSKHAESLAAISGVMGLLKDALKPMPLPYRGEWHDAHITNVQLLGDIKTKMMPFAPIPVPPEEPEA
jgi:hypothetical protein